MLHRVKNYTFSKKKKKNMLWIFETLIFEILMSGIKGIWMFVLESVILYCWENEPNFCLGEEAVADNLFQCFIPRQSFRPQHISAFSSWYGCWQWRNWEPLVIKTSVSEEFWRKWWDDSTSFAYPWKTGLGRLARHCLHSSP